jgi:hypothetical protein
MKDENYFANAPGLRLQEPVAGGNRWANRQKGSHLPQGTEAGALLFLAGESPLAQLPERHLAAHRLAVGLA